MTTTVKTIVLAAVVAFCGTATSALAAPEDLYVGSFSGTWCGYDAQFDLVRKNPGWEFEGKIRIKSTNQYDRLWIRQHRDNSLQIIRYLSGAQSGSSQNVTTFPPQMTRSGGELYARFDGAAGGGPGCKNAPVQLNVRAQ